MADTPTPTTTSGGQDRQDRGPRTSRHVITNFRADFSDDAHATTYCVMMLLAADGTPVLPSAPLVPQSFWNRMSSIVDRCFT